MRKLRVASCQFPVTGDIGRNARYVRRYMQKAAEAGAHLLHTSETCLSGYARHDFPSFDGYDWARLREETARLRRLARQLRLWLVLGSTHFLAWRIKPTNCLYIIDPRGRIVDRYDKRMCTPPEQKRYSAGCRFVVLPIRGVKVGFAICYDICFPQIYAAYRELGVKLMLHSFYNAGDKGKNCLDVLNVRQVPTRCADNRMWAVANNSSRPYSHWASFVARPDATIARQLKINQAGMLVHDFPDGLSPGGWLHNRLPMKLAKDQRLTFGTPSNHARQRDPRAAP
ncbi:MAG: carbon-nitrogen hydrolase family protein [Kiritimatiellae bacterium]|nr:carbon-nitrogen hydrolase family protein [Kiritimatiellia bacterium]